MQDPIFDEALLLRLLLESRGSEEVCLQGPVGARLKSFWRVWSGLGAEPWVVEVLREGFRIPFTSAPPLSDVPIQLGTYRPGSEKFQVLQKEVQAIVENEAVVVQDALGSGF